MIFTDLFNKQMREQGHIKPIRPNLVNTPYFTWLQNRLRVNEENESRREIFSTQEDEVTSTEGNLMSRDRSQKEMLTAKDFQLQYGNSSITFVFQTPLHLAVITHQKYLVEKLVEGGADVNLMDRHGQTALHLACQNGDIHSVLAIRDVTHRCHMQIRLDLKNFQGEHITTVPRRAAVD